MRRNMRIIRVLFTFTLILLFSAWISPSPSEANESVHLLFSVDSSPATGKFEPGISRLGFTVVSLTRFEGLKMDVFRLRLPIDSHTDVAVRKLEAAFPEAIVDIDDPVIKDEFEIVLD
jgi:hypothetical protein